MNIQRVKNWIVRELTDAATSNEVRMDRDEAVEAFEILDELNAALAGTVPPETTTIQVGLRTIEITKALHREIQDFIDSERKIPAIKALREMTGLGLKEAKDAVEDKKNWDWTKNYAQRWERQQEQERQRRNW